MDEKIQTLWIGERLSPLERISLCSFLAHGHQVDLYAYSDVANVPEGVAVRDAAEILPPSTIFKYRDYDSYAGFSNYFRYKLLLERGGYWIDSDIVCLRPFDFETDHVFATEPRESPPEPSPVGMVSCVLKAPAGSSAMKYAWESCRAKDPARLVWNETGSWLMKQCVEELGMQTCAQPPEVFCPLAPWLWRRFLEPGADLGITHRSYSIHAWNEMWRREGGDKEAYPDPRSYYHYLWKTYL